jgi:carbonic anhydrase
MSESLLKGNSQWVQKMKPEFFQKLGNPQKPSYLYIGCSDARVDPIQLLGLEIGTLFIHRNVGNLVYENDDNIGAVIEYAMTVLAIPNILVVGHYDCGAVRAARCESCKMTWISGLRKIALENKTSSERRLAELNVIQQCTNISTITKRFNRVVIGFIFDPKDGLLKQLY